MITFYPTTHTEQVGSIAYIDMTTDFAFSRKYPTRENIPAITIEEFYTSITGRYGYVDPVLSESEFVTRPETYFTDSGSTTSTVIPTPVVVGGYWTTTSSLNIPRMQHASCGTSLQALAFCGDSTIATIGTDGHPYDYGFLISTEKWNGTIWTTTGSLPHFDYRVKSLAGCGNTSNALAIGGWVKYSQYEHYNIVSSISFIWNGTVWALTSQLATSRCDHTAVGNSDAAFAMGGRDAYNVYQSVENWNGSVWSTTQQSLYLLERTAYHCACGSTSSALSFGGSSANGIKSSYSEKWNGTAWATTDSINISSNSAAGCGINNTSAMLFGGDANMIHTEKWDGTAWASTSTLNKHRAAHAGCGNVRDALACGGTNLQEILGSTEIWIDKTVKDDGSSYDSEDTSMDPIGYTYVYTSGWATAQAYPYYTNPRSGSSEIKGTRGHSGWGSVTNAMGAGGWHKGPTGSGDEYDVDHFFNYSYRWSNYRWDLVGNLNQNRAYSSGVGTATDALVFGGWSAYTSRSGFMIYWWDTVNVTISSSERFLSNVWATTGTQNMKSPRYGFAAVGTSTNALAIGGSTEFDSPFVKSMEIYSGSTWSTTSTTLSSARGFLSACGTTNNALAIGGENNDNSYSKTVEKWNGSIWTTTTSLNIPRSSLAGVGTIDSAITFGGYNGTFLGTTERWNGNSWTTKTSMSIARADLAGAGTGSTALAFGGAKSNNSVNDCAIASSEKYTESSRWVTAPIVDKVWNLTASMNIARFYHAGAGKATTALAFGGTTDVFKPTDSTEIWKNSCWTITNSMLQNSQCLGGCGTANNALAFGGLSAATINTTTLWNGNVWTTTASMLSQRQSLAGCGTSKEAIVSGGTNYLSKHSTCEKWDGTAWATTTSLSPTPAEESNYRRANHASCGSVYHALIFGGDVGINFGQTNEYSSRTNSTQIWDGTTWATTSSLTSSKTSLCGCGNIFGALAISGIVNNNATSQTEKFDGTVWSITSSCIGAKFSSAACGTAGSALSFGGTQDDATPLSLTEWFTDSSYVYTDPGGGADEDTQIPGIITDEIESNVYTFNEEGYVANIANWTLTSSLNIYRNSLAGCGTATESIAFGGVLSGPLFYNTTEKWFNAIWSNTSSLNQRRYGLSGCGDGSGALAFGGSAVVEDIEEPIEEPIEGPVDTTEMWIGNAWTLTSSLLQPRFLAASCGNSYGALVFGGHYRQYYSSVEKWFMNNWTTSVPLNTAKSSLAGCGNPLRALAFGGFTGDSAVLDTTERWNGTAWSTTGTLNQAKSNLAGCGNAYAALSFGGVSVGPTYLGTTEKFNAIVWTTTSSLNVNRCDLAGCGDTHHALSFGGEYGQSVNTTEKFDISRGTVITNSIKSIITPIESITLIEKCYDNNINDKSTAQLSFDNGVTWTDVIDYNTQITNFTNSENTFVNKISGWATTSPLNISRMHLAGCGNVDNALSFGGFSGTSYRLNYSEKWNGTMWHTTSSIPIAKYLFAACGTINKAITFGGNSTSYMNITDEWNGISWSTTSSHNLLSARHEHAGCGNADNALAISGNRSGGYATNERWNAISWSTISSLNYLRNRLAASGDVKTALAFGGLSGTLFPTTEKWNSVTSVWTTTSATLQTPRFYLAGCGDVNNSLSFGGCGVTSSDSYSAATEMWNGDIWSVVPSMNTSRYGLAGCGNCSDALSFGGTTSTINTNGGQTNIAERYSTNLKNIKLKFNLTQYYVSGIWAIKSSLNTARYGVSGCGDNNGALSFGGSTLNGTYSNVTEIWDGNAWAITSNMNYNRLGMSGCGDISRALSFGGYADSILSIVERWNGVTWSYTSANNLLNSRDFSAAAGNATKSLVFGGNSVAVPSEKWDGSTWSITSSLNEIKRGLAGCGTTSNALTFGGVFSANLINTTEKWNGIIWSTSTAMNQSRYNLSGCGTSDYAISFGGYVGNNVATTELWNNNVWNTVTSMNVAKNKSGGCGSVTNSLAFGGDNGLYHPSNMTEHFVVNPQTGFKIAINKDL